MQFLKILFVIMFWARDMGIFFQTIHPVEYSRPVPQAMAKKLFNKDRKPFLPLGTQVSFFYSMP